MQFLKWIILFLTFNVQATEMVLEFRQPSRHVRIQAQDVISIIVKFNTKAPSNEIRTLKVITPEKEWEIPDKKDYLNYLYQEFVSRDIAGNWKEMDKKRFCAPTILLKMTKGEKKEFQSCPSSKFNQDKKINLYFDYLISSFELESYLLED